jgi:hypothetical protein
MRNIYVWCSNTFYAITQRFKHRKCTVGKYTLTTECIGRPFPDCWARCSNCGATLKLL